MPCPSIIDRKGRKKPKKHGHLQTDSSTQLALLRPEESQGGLQDFDAVSKNLFRLTLRQLQHAQGERLTDVLRLATTLCRNSEQMRSLLRTEAGDFGLYKVFRAYALQKPRPSCEQGEWQQWNVISDTLWLMQICSGLGSVESVIEDEALWGALESDPAQGIGVLNWLLWNVGYDRYSLLETTSLEAVARTGSRTGSCGADTAMLMKRPTDAGGSPKKYASTASIAEDLRVSERAIIVVKKCLGYLNQLGLQRFGELSAATQVDIRETLQSACKVLRKCVAIENTARIRHDVDAATAAALFHDKHVWQNRLNLLNDLSGLVSLPGRAFWQLFAVSDCSTGSEGEEENGSTSSNVAKSASEAYAELLDVVTALLRVDHAQLPSPSNHLRTALSGNTHRFCEELVKIFVETAHSEDERVFRKFLPFLVEWRGDQGFLELWVEGRGWRRSAMLLYETLHFVLQDLMVVGGPGAEAALQREADNLVYQLVASGGSVGGDAGDRSPTSSGVEADVDGSRRGSDDGESEPDETDDQQATSYRPIDFKHLGILLDADLINILSEDSEWYSGTPPGLVPQIAGAQLDAWLEKAAAQQQLQGECAAAVGFLITQLLYFATGMIVPESRALLLSDAYNEDARLQAGATWRGNESVVLHTLQALKQGLVRRPDLLSSAGASRMLLDYRDPQSITWRVLDPSGGFTAHVLLCQALFEVLLLLDAGVAHQVLQEPRFQNQIKVKHIKAAADAYRALFEANAIDLEQGECLERLRLWEGIWRELQTHRRRAPRDTVAPAPPAANGSSGLPLRLCSPPEQALEWTCGSEVLVPVLQAQTLLCVRVLQKGARECRGREAEGAVVEKLRQAPGLNLSTVEDVHAWAQHPSNERDVRQLLAREREEKSRAFWCGASGDGPLRSVWENVCSVLYHHRKDDDADAAGPLLHCLVDSVLDLPGEFVRDWMRLQLVEGHRYHQHHSVAPQIAPAHTYGLEKLMTRLLRNANAHKLYGSETSVQSLCVAVFVIEALKSGTCSTAIAPLRKNPKDRRRQRMDALRLLIEKKQGCGTVEARRQAVEELMVFERTIDAREMPRIAQTVRWCKRKIEEMNAVEAASTSAVGRPQ